MLLHTEAFTQKTLLHIEIFLYRRFYTQKLLHRNTFTHAEAFTHRCFYAQKLFTHIPFYTHFAGQRANRNLPSVFGDRSSFSCERVEFCAVSLALPLHPAFKREIEKKERASGQEGKTAKGQEEKMWRCEDVNMWRWEDEKMWRCEDEKMSG